MTTATDTVMNPLITGLATKHVVVFGGTGQQGSAFVRALGAYNTDPAAPHYTIHVLTRSKGPVNVSSVPGVKAVYCENYMDVPLMAFEATGVLMGQIHGVFDVQGYVSEKEDEEQGKRIVDAAAEWGVKHFIYASVSHDETVTLGHDGLDTKRAVERHLKANDAGMKWTMLADTDFMDNWLPDQRFTLKAYRTILLRKTFHKRPDAKLAMISTRDIGRAGAKALHEPETYANTSIYLAGDALSMSEVVEIYKDVMGGPPTETWGLVATIGLWSDPHANKLTKFYDAKGYDINLEATKKVLPDVEDFRAFLERFKREHANKA